MISETLRLGFNVINVFIMSLAVEPMREVVMSLPVLSEKMKPFLDLQLEGRG